MENKEGPCLEKNCSWCCNPVKVGFSKRVGINEVEPKKDRKGEDIWEDTGEIFIPENHPESMLVKTFKCINYDKDSGRCQDYENRPEVCRNTSCINPESRESIDEQHKKVISESFFKLNKR